MHLESLDHLALTVAGVGETCTLYARVLGMVVATFGQKRTALRFGQEINLHEVGREFGPKAAKPTAGSGDLCLVAAAPLDAVLDHLAACGVARTGAVGSLRSFHVRDPDGALIEIAKRVGAAPAPVAG